jgi:hypothetical protein
MLAVGEVEVLQRQADTEAAGHGFEHAHAFGHDFLADAVTGDDGDAMGLLHACSPAKNW